MVRDKFVRRYVKGVGKKTALDNIAWAVPMRGEEAVVPESFEHCPLLLPVLGSVFLVFSFSPLIVAIACV